MTKTPSRRSTPSRPGRFVVLEGLDGAGTTTQLMRVCAELRRAGHTVHTTCEPSTGPVGTLLRQALTRRLVLPGGNKAMGDETLALLFAADRIDHLEAEIIPALERGEIVMCDRYVLSSLAYQGASLPMSWIEEINARSLVPDLTLFLEVDIGTARHRRASRGGPVELFDEDEKQRRIRRQYLEAMKRRSTTERIVRVDGTATPEDVTRELCAHIDTLLARRKRARA